jgi:hypothetical protein
MATEHDVGNKFREIRLTSSNIVTGDTKKYGDCVNRFYLLNK